MPKNNPKYKRKNILLSFLKSFLLFAVVFIVTFLALELLFKDPLDDGSSKTKVEILTNETDNSSEKFEDTEYGFAKIDKSLFDIKEEDNNFNVRSEDKPAQTENIKEPEDFPEPDYYFEDEKSVTN